MTEAEWLEGTDPMPMLEYLGVKASERKLRLFACACARDVEECTIREGCVSVTELAERYAEGQATPAELEAASAEVEYAAYGQVYSIGCAFGVIQDALDPNSYESATQAAKWLKGFYSLEGSEYPGRLKLIAFYRDIFGNPFRPITVHPSWLTSTVLTLAEGIYTERAFDRLPILADALQDAGCDNEDILSHCRSEGPHVKGCWAVDLLLGKQ